MTKPTEVEQYWDVFICHASEDKEEIARPLAQKLVTYQLKVWFDEFEVKVGDSLTEKIEHGLSNSNFGVLILSKKFILKPWPKKERNALFQREINEGRQVLLPIKHGINQEIINRTYPLLSDTFTLDSQEGIDQIAEKIITKIKGKEFLQTQLESIQTTFDRATFSDDMLVLLQHERVALFNRKRQENRKISLDLHDQDLGNKNLNGADLSEVNLISSKLNGARLEFANLYGANLMYADLSRANLHYAVLRYANLERAILKSAFLEYAYLDRADLQYADLTNASLRYANVECADLRFAIINGTNLYQTFGLPITRNEAAQRGAIFSYL